MMNKALVKAILEHADSYEWSVQGLGMLRLYLGDEYRLHIWHRDLQVEGVTEIHDHPWGFNSQVIVGGICNHRYEFFTDGIKHLAQPYTRGELFCGTGGGLTGVMVHGLLFKKAEDEYYEGQYYKQKYDEIHRTDFIDGTVTLIQRDFSQEDKDHAHVFWKIGEQFVSAEPRPATKEEVFKTVKAALERWI